MVNESCLGNFVEQQSCVIKLLDFVVFCFVVFEIGLNLSSKFFHQQIAQTLPKTNWLRDHPKHMWGIEVSAFATCYSPSSTKV